MDIGGHDCDDGSCTCVVERDIGPELARTVAKKMVIHHRRGGVQSQLSALLQLDPTSDRIQTALAFREAHLHTKLTLEKLAEVTHLLPRPLIPALSSETCRAPA